MSIPDPTPETNIRLAKFSEVYQCAQVLGKAFYDDVLFGRHIHVHRAMYPDDMALYFYRKMQSECWDWAMAFVVSTEKDKRGEEVITGVAQWHRLGDDARQRGWGLSSWDPRRLLEPIAHIMSTFASHVNPNRAIAPSKIDILERADPFIKHIWTGPRQNHWYLHFLGVHPDHQGKGLGRKLVAWGIDQAKEEGVGASVIAAHTKDQFYQRCGFREVLGRAGDGEGNPLGEIPGGSIWWVSPDGGENGKGGKEAVEITEVRV